MSECRTSDGKPKVRFATRADARRRLRELPELDGCQPYRCGRCGWFHLGHYPADEKARRGLRERRRTAT